jgi:hypothetical protein
MAAKSMSFGLQNQELAAKLFAPPESASSKSAAGTGTPNRNLAADANGAEAQNYVAAGGGPPETHHGPEAREE